MSVKERSWMYEGRNDNGCHFEDWVRNTNAFLDHAFGSVPNAEKSCVPCPYIECGNRVRPRRAVMSVQLCKRGFMPRCTRRTEHGEPIVSLSTPEDAFTRADGLDEMLAELGDAMHINSVEEEPTSDANAFYDMLSTTKEPLHNLTHVSRLTAVARLMVIKSEHNLIGECINNLFRLFGVILPANHKMPSNLYECKSLLKGLKIPYVKIDVCVNNCMIYYKEDDQNEKCDICGESHFAVVGQDNPGRK
jgi:hypothetical protein